MRSENGFHRGGDRWQRGFQLGSDKLATSGDVVLEPHIVLALARDPKYRLQDRPELIALANRLLRDPNDMRLQRRFQQGLMEQAQRYRMSDDLFYSQYPPRHAFPPRPGWIPYLATPVVGRFRIPYIVLTLGLLVLGATGTGKSVWSRLMLAALSAQPQCLAIGFDLKGDLADSPILARSKVPVRVLHFSELMIALLQPPPSVSQRQWLNVLTDFLCSHLNLWASGRLLRESLGKLCERHNAPGTWPTFEQAITYIMNVKATAGSRLLGYKEALLSALIRLQDEVGIALDYRASDFFCQLFARRRELVVVQLTGLSPQVAGLIAGLFIIWAFEARGAEVPDENDLLFFLLDDAFAAMAGSARLEAEGQINPLGRVATLARSRGIGLGVCTQSLTSTSPAFASNAQNVICCGAWGPEIQAVARHLNLNDKQAAMLPALKPGEAIGVARSVWPHAIYGRIPPDGS